MQRIVRRRIVLQRIVHATNCPCDELSGDELSCNELSMRRIVRNELSATNCPATNCPVTPPDTFFNGSSCQSQKLLGADCNNSAECRADLNYTCLSRMQCGRKYRLYTICLDLINKVLLLYFLSMVVALNSKFSM
jgi:hypothetical protein